MKISSQIAWEFDRESITSGYRIYRRGDVMVDLEPDGTVLSLVGDSRVRLRIKGNALETNCTCRDFRADNQCAHIWAALLNAEEADLLMPRPLGRILLEHRLEGKREPALKSAPQPKPTPPAPKKLWKSRAEALVRASFPDTGQRFEWPALSFLPADVPGGCGPAGGA